MWADRSQRAAVVGLALAALLAAGCGARRGSEPVGAAGSLSATPSGATTAPAAALARATGATAAPTPARAASTPCTGNAESHYVFVSLHRQHLWMCAQHRVAYSTAITSGMVGPYTQTPTGTFAVQARERNTTLTLNTGATYAVKYWIPFQAPLFGFHDSPWQNFPYGSTKYRTAGSHGCVHMPLPAIAFLYNWATVGTTVRITA